MAAIVLYAKPINLHSVAGIFRYISSGLFGRLAFSGGKVYPLAGLVIHYLVAIFWSSVYVLIVFRNFKPGFLWIKMILFHCTVWILINGFVLPLAGFSSVHNNAWSICKSFFAILLCVGFPICLITEMKLHLFDKLQEPKR